MVFEEKDLNELREEELDEIAGGAGTASGTSATITGDYVRLRSSKDTTDTSNVLCMLRKGTKVTLVRRGTSWCRVIYKGREGFVGSQYVK